MLAEKLAYDIHTLMGFREGGDFSSHELKEMISHSWKHRSLSVPVPMMLPIRDTPPRCTDVTSNTEPVQRPAKISSTSSTANHVPMVDFNELSETVRVMKTEILTIKQCQSASESVCKQQVSELKDCLPSVEDQLVDLKCTWSVNINTLKLCLTQIEETQSSSIVVMKNDLALLKQDMKSCETSVQLIESRIQKCLNSQNPSKPQKVRIRKNLAKQNQVLHPNPITTVESGGGMATGFSATPDAVDDSEVNDTGCASLGIQSVTVSGIHSSDHSIDVATVHATSQEGATLTYVCQSDAFASGNITNHKLRKSHWVILMLRIQTACLYTQR